MKQEPNLMHQVLKDAIVLEKEEQVQMALAETANVDLVRENNMVMCMTSLRMQ